MAYSVVGIVNMALSRIGVKAITTADWAYAAAGSASATNQANKAYAVWEYIRDEVLAVRDWKFARTRKALGQITETPASEFDYAYLLPDDFLRLVTGNDDDPAVYPDGYDYSIESMDTTVSDINPSDFNPASAYAANDIVKIGRYAVLAISTTKILYVAAPYGLDYATLLKVECVSGTTDTLAVTADESTHIITITLANTTSAKNAANLIQVALRALADVDDISVAAWTVTENAAYAAARPTTGVDIDPQPMGNGDEFYTCLDTINASATNTSRFPSSDTAYWSKLETYSAPCLLTDYDSISGGEELVISYIRRITDPIVYSPNFINALAFRLAAELSIPLTEGTGKWGAMMKLYLGALVLAAEVDLSSEYIETPDSWDEAGR